MFIDVVGSNPILSNIIPPSILPKEEKVKKRAEEKTENELDVNDRLYLMNKRMEDIYLVDTFLDILKTDTLILEIPTSKMNSYVIDDIELFGDHFGNEDKGIFQKINCTKTKMGEMVLKNILKNPIYDINILRRRQKMILDLGRMKKDIGTRLKRIREIENEFIWFWNDQNMKHIDMMNDLIYFNYDIIPFINVNNILNKNEKALYITNMYKILGAPLLTILTPLVSLVVPLVMFMVAKKRFFPHMSMMDLLKIYFKTIYNFNPMAMLGGGTSVKAATVSFFTKAFYVFMYFQNVYYSIQSAKNTHQIINIMHEKLNRVAEYIRSADEIREICERGGIKRLESFLTDEKRFEKELKETKVHFEDKTFEKEPSLWSHKGIILKTFQEFRKMKGDLHSSFQYIATIDAILSIYEMYEKGTKENPYCLSEYIDMKKRPQINMKEIWHPYLDKSVSEKIVKNDLQMKNHIIVTGPNAGGKSTFIKSVIVNLLMAQTICINSGEEFRMTPFKMIETYLHIPDSKGSQSLFEAEMYRSRDYLERLKEMEEDDFSFIVLDEIFSSTNYIEGYSGAYAILKKISSFDNALSITTTHYSDLEKLEKDTNGRVENYKFEVSYDENGEIQFHYQLKRGVSRQYIALELLKKSGFEEDIINTAIEISKKITIQCGEKEKKEKKKKNKVKKDIKKKEIK